MRPVWPWYIIVNNSGDVPFGQRRKTINFLDELLVELARFNQMRAYDGIEGAESRVVVLFVGDSIRQPSLEVKMLRPDEVKLSPHRFRGKANYSVPLEVLDKTASVSFFSPEARPICILQPEVMYIGVEPENAAFRKSFEYPVENRWIRHADRIAVCFGAETESRFDSPFQVLYYDEFANNCAARGDMPIVTLVDCSYNNSATVVSADIDDLWDGGPRGIIMETQGSKEWLIASNAEILY